MKIQLADKLHCTGCAACANSCSHKAITMQPDEEGFLQPDINTNLCVECGLCMNRCPVLKPLDIALSNQIAYAVISKIDRKVSSSGGAFSIFARKILNQGGIVFGASIDSNFKVKHIAIEHFDELFKLRGSKYVQSEIGDCYQQVKKYLLQQRKVLFTGTPCQVAGLYAFLNGKRYDELLITLDLVCHGVPSQGCFDAYIQKLKRSTRLKGENIKGFRFRKFDSWSIVPAVELSESKLRILNLSENAYMNAFFEGIIFRESCYRCQYCNTQRVGTFTIADFWGIGRHGQKFSKNVACGVSLVLDNKGIMPKLVSDLSNQAYIEERSMEEAIAEQTNLKSPLKRMPIRDNAVAMMMDPNQSLCEFAQACGLPWKLTVKTIVVTCIKNTIYALGLYNVYKTLIYKIGK